jgi:coatomer protein complex subunit alpha (xenin)
LQRKGYPEIALQFVKDPKTRFDLALECGNIEVALEMAKQIDMDAYWSKLGDEAKKQGNQVILEFVYQKLKKFESLSFLYLVTGSKPKLDKMLKIATSRNDFNSRFQNACFSGNYRDEIEILLESGQLSLAYLMAQSYGMDEFAAKILEQAGVDAPVLPAPGNLLRAPYPVVRQINTNWPRVAGNDDKFEQSRLRAAQAAPVPIETAPSPQMPAEPEADWRADAAVESEPAFEDEGEGWDLDADLELSDAVLSPTKSTASSIPKVYKSRIATDYLCRGDFNTGMEVSS